MELPVPPSFQFGLEWVQGKTSNSKCLLHVIIPISSIWSYDNRLNSIWSFQALVFALSAILFASKSSDLSHAHIFIVFVMKMVVSTIIADLNDHTVRFKDLLGKSSYIRLMSCSQYNSWYNLKRRGKVSIFDRQNNASVKMISSGKYTLESLAKALGKILSEEKGFKVTMNCREPVWKGKLFSTESCVTKNSTKEW